MPQRVILTAESVKARISGKAPVGHYITRHLCEIYERQDHVLEVKDRQLNRELNLSKNDDHKEEIRKHIASNTQQKTGITPSRQENSKLHFTNELAFAYIDGMVILLNEVDLGNRFRFIQPGNYAERSARALVEHIYSLRLGSRDMPVNIKESYARLVVQALKDDAKLETWDGTGTRDTAPDVNRAIPYGYIVVSSFSSGATTADTTRGYRLTERREVLVSHVLRNVRKPWVEGPI